jgi:hypothetical protein
VGWGVNESRNSGGFVRLRKLPLGTNRGAGELVLGSKMDTKGYDNFW